MTTRDEPLASSGEPDDAAPRCRRLAAAAVPVLPPGAEPAVPGRADAAGGRRPDDGRDRRRLPRPRGDDGPAHQPGQAAGARRPDFEMPPPAERAERLRSVLHVLYLVFNEGYTASSGADARPRRPDRRGHAPDPRPAPRCCRRGRGRRAAGADAAHRGPPGDARRRRRGAGAARRAGPLALGRALIEEGDGPRGGDPARRSRSGRTRCRRRSPPSTPRRRRSSETDWAQIRGLYDVLERIAPNPMVTLNRAVAVAMVDGRPPGWRRSTSWTAAGRSATTTASPPSAPTSSSWPATRQAARDEYRRAARLTTSRPEQRYLEARARRLATP